MELHFAEKLQPLPPAIEQDVYRVAQEAIENAARHAKAKTVSVTLIQTSGRLTLTVRDNGRGFDLSTPSAGYSLRGMRERAEMLGGTLNVTSAVGRDNCRIDLSGERIIRVLICDDQDLVCEGLRAILEASSEIQVAGVAHDGAEAVELVAKSQPDVVLMDLKMPIM